MRGGAVRRGAGEQQQLPLQVAATATPPGPCAGAGLAPSVPHPRACMRAIVSSEWPSGAQATPAQAAH